jgi:ESCRT-II complex subunit VPS36
MVTFTTHRILWIDQKIRRGGFIPLPAISQIYPPKKDIKSMFFSAPRIKVEVYLTLEGTPSLQGHLNATSFAFISVVLRNQSGGDSAFLRLAEILRMKAWERSEKEKLERRKHHGPGMPMEPSTSTMQVVAGPSRASPAMAGLSGILRKEQEQWEETDKNLQEAFVDLNALMVSSLQLYTHERI